MSSASRALSLLLPLAMMALWGVIYSPDRQLRESDESTDVALASLPALPAWAGAELPDFSRYQDTEEKKNAFFSFLYPRIVLANSRILMERAYLESLASKEQLSESELDWLTEQGKRLRVESQPGSETQLARLRSRLDVIPPSLILAQAANESAWGTSRFATQGNNLFGQWCFSRGCGLVPESREEGANHEVAAFSSPYRSVRAYIQNLNRHRAYDGVRQLRAKARQQGRMPTGSALAAGLISYSERGMAYVEEIREMIAFNQLGNYDQQFSDVLEQLPQDGLQQLAAAASAEKLLPANLQEETPDNEG